MTRTGGPKKAEDPGPGEQGFDFKGPRWREDVGDTVPGRQRRYRNDVAPDQRGSIDAADSIPTQHERGPTGSSRDRSRASSRFEQQETVMATGTIKRLIPDRGFGFIAGDDAKEYFFHRDAIEPPLTFERLASGEKVAFDVTSGPKGPRAARVRHES